VLIWRKRGAAACGPSPDQLFAGRFEQGEGADDIGGDERGRAGDRPVDV